MNREIKFRVWNGMEMVYDVTVGKFGTFYVNPEKGDGLNPNDSASLTPNTTKYHEMNPVMQFTGLLDCHGKEIYEGDILKLGETCSFVVWCLDRWRFNSYMERGTLELYPYVDRTTGKELAEIIGNIYETPELLNSEQGVQECDTSKA